MNRREFESATSEEREGHVIKPYEEVRLTTLVPGSDSHLVFGENVCISFLTMKAGSSFEIHSHPEEQIMIVVEGYCDEIIDGKIYHVQAGDVLHLPSGIPHGAFILDVDCKAIDIFSPVRKDYAEKFVKQNPNYRMRFVNID